MQFRIASCAGFWRVGGAARRIASRCPGHRRARSRSPPARSFNNEKLAKITEFFKNEVETGKIAGADVLIRQHGKPVYHETFGVQDVVSKAPITDKTIFRLSSLTKAITSVVAMQLIQDGKIKLDDPVSKYIPSFAKMKVGEEKKAEDGTKTLELVPLTRPITVLDLMRHTSGITYGFYGDSLVRKAYKEANLYAGEFDLAEFAERIAKLPLHNQPGALWQYGHSTDILARIMEIVSGKSLFEIEKEKLLDPLGMTDTGFFVTEPERLGGSPSRCRTTVISGSAACTGPRFAKSGNPPAAAWFRPCRTSRNLRRCWPMAVRSRARPISARRRSN